jgi:hypothetical protein
MTHMDRLKVRPTVAGTGGIIAATLGLLVGAGEAAAKIPGSTHCYFGICHRVKTLPETERLIGRKIVVKSSFYDDCHVDRFNPCTLTSSGEVFKPHRPDNAASPIYPDGTKLLLWNPKTKAAAIVRVNSAGPYHSNRTLDVSRATAEKLGFRQWGVANLHIQVLSAPTQKETVYKKHRVYPAVAGPIGKFASFDLAVADTDRHLGNPINPTGSSRLAAKPLSPEFKITSLPLDNGKALKAAGRNATMASMAMAAGTPGQATATSASAIFMNSIPHNMLPAGVLSDVKPRITRVQIKAAQIGRTPRKAASPIARKI